MRVAICDDDSIYVKEIKQILQNVFNENNLDVCFDLYTDSCAIVDSKTSYDIAFLDIEMPSYNGIQVSERLKNINPYIVIFIITSFDQYLDDAMDLNVFRYIKKPLNASRLKSGIIKALEQIDNNIIKFNLKKDNISKIVTSNEIIFVETVGRYTKIVTTNGEYISVQKMDFWKDKLIATFFFKVHKSFIVNLKHLTDYKRDMVTLFNDYQIPISYRKQSEFRSYFFRYFGGR